MSNLSFRNLKGQISTAPDILTNYWSPLAKHIETAPRKNVVRFAEKVTYWASPADMIARWNYGNKSKTYHPARRKNKFNVMDEWRSKKYRFPRGNLVISGIGGENGVKDLARPPKPVITGDPSGILKKGPFPEKGILKRPSRTDSDTLTVASAKGLPFMKGEPDNTAEPESYDVEQSSSSRNGVLRPEDPIGNTGHSRDRLEKLKVRVPTSKFTKVRNKYANRRARKLQKRVEEALLAIDLDKASLANLESELRSLETENPDFVNMQLSEQSIHNLEEQSVSEGGSHELPLPPGWKSTVPQWNDLNEEANWSEGERWSDTRAETLYNLKQITKLSRLSRLPRSALKEIFGNQAVLDSGATSTFIKPEHGAIPTGEKSNKIVRVPNGQSMIASEKAMLPNKKLRDEARECDILPGLHKDSLISVGKLADAGYYTIFMPGNQGVQVIDGTKTKMCLPGEAILRGWRDHQGLWRVPIAEEEYALPDEDLEESLNNVFDLPSLEQTIRYLHACAGFPTRRTWIKAIKKGNYVGWPVLTEQNVNKYFPESTETVKGHMNHQRQGVRSTKRKPQDPEDIDTKSEVGKKERDIYTKVIDLWDQKETIYTDQTGNLPVQSRSGNRFIMVMVAIDSNAILVTPVKDHTDQQLRNAYLTLLKRVKNAGVQVKKHILDNECSENMKEVIKQECELELVPPGCHRRNIAEVGIKIFKNHFISILSGTDPSFPLSLWDKLLPQAELTVNLLRQSNSTPTVSAHAHLFGMFDFNKMPLAPLGCGIQIHEDTDKRKSWAPHTIDGWYLGTSPEHYRAHRVYAKSTNSERISETVFFKHKYLTNPTISHADKVVNAARELYNALSRKKQGLNSTTMKALQDLSKMFLDRAKTDQKDSWNESENQPTPPLSGVSSSGIEPRTSLSSTRQLTPTPPVIHGPEVSDDVDPPQKPKRIAKELKNLQSTRVLGSNGPPSMNTRSRCVAAVVAALTATSPTSAKMWNPRPSKSKAERLYAVLEGDRMLNYRQLISHPKLGEQWQTSSANEFGRLAQGIGGRIKGTNTIFFIKKEDIPEERMKDITYGKFVCNVRPEKDEKNRTRLVVGGNRINYPGDVGTPTADMLLAKIIFNSVISTKGAKFMTADISNFYLNTPLPRSEYVKLSLTVIPQEVIDEYSLQDKATKDGHVYIKINKGMYGLPQAGILAQDLLAKRLEEHGYYQSNIIPGLWKHKTRPILFSLVVDDFGIKYSNKEDVDHLLSVLKENYKIKEDWKGERYIGLHMRWDYQGRKVHVAMPEYVQKALNEFQYEMKKRKQYSPFACATKKYGKESQVMEEPKPSKLLDKAGQKLIQKITGKFLYLGRGVDSTLLTPLSAIAAQQAKPTEKTMEQAKQLLDYIASQEDAVITYKASDMVLAVHSDAGYHNESGARSRAGGHFFLSNNDEIPPNNGSILNVAQIIKAVMSSAAEAELGALYINAREAVHIRNILEEMGHPQPPTPIQVDNSTAEGVVNNKVQPKRMKTMDMRFHWLRCRKNQEQFRFHWRPGTTNLADYWTKHHPGIHHKNFRREILTPVNKVQKLFKTGNSGNLLRGCVEHYGA